MRKQIKRFMKGFLPVVASGLIILGIARSLEDEVQVEVGKEKIERGYVEEAMPQKQENPLIAYVRYTGNFEGRRNRVYDPNLDDRKDEPTIGVGHYLGRGDSRKTFARVLPEVNYDSILRGEQELTNEQVDKLFAEDIQEYVGKARTLFPKFDEYPEYLRQALVDGCYRGDLVDSPKTRKLINEGNFEGASEEYIDREDYRKAQRTGKMIGILTRMNTNRKAMLRYAKESNLGK